MPKKNPSPQQESNPRIGKGDGNKNDTNIRSKKKHSLALDYVHIWCASIST